jgi:hypothetical protein
MLTGAGELDAYLDEIESVANRAARGLCCAGR